MRKFMSTHVNTPLRYGPRAANGRGTGVPISRMIRSGCCTAKTVRAGSDSTQYGVACGGDDVLLVPLHGHTRGHCSVAVRAADGWLLHCGDAYFHHGEIQTPPHCPPGLRAFQNPVQVDSKSRISNQQRLRELAEANSGLVRLFSAHDPAEL